MALKDHYDNLNELKADVLHEMREVLHDQGWVQGTLENDENQVCFMGAYNTVLFGKAEVFRFGYRKQLNTLPIQRRYVYESLLKEVKKHLAEMFPLDMDNIHYEGWQIERWNDTKGRTFEEVEKAIMQMADYYETRYLEGLQS